MADDVKKKKILIAEDERPMLRALELKLSHEGFEVVTATNGNEALEKIEADQFDLILLDLVMPEVDGFAVLEDLRQHRVMTPVFVLSNLSQGQDEKRALDLGASQFFVKSNTPIASIVESINKFFT